LRIRHHRRLLSSFPSINNSPVFRFSHLYKSRALEQQIYIYETGGGGGGGRGGEKITSNRFMGVFGCLCVFERECNNTKTTRRNNSSSNNRRRRIKAPNVLIASFSRAHRSDSVNDERNCCCCGCCCKHNLKGKEPTKVKSRVVVVVFFSLFTQNKRKWDHEGGRGGGGGGAVPVSR